MRIYRRLIALVCCAALLLSALPTVSAADELLNDGFEGYGSQAELLKNWQQTGSAKTDLPQLDGSTTAHGQRALLLNDTEFAKSLHASRQVKNPCA